MAGSSTATTLTVEGSSFQNCSAPQEVHLSPLAGTGPKRSPHGSLAHTGRSALCWVVFHGQYFLDVLC